MSRQAALIVAEDVSFSVGGKMNITGAFSTDIYIPLDQWVVNQMVFIFLIETAPDDLFERISLHVELPGGDKRDWTVPVNTYRLGEADKIRWSLKFPLLFQSPILRPGPIIAYVIHEKGLLAPAAPVVVLRPPTPALATHTS